MSLKMTQQIAFWKKKKNVAEILVLFLKENNTNILEILDTTYKWSFLENIQEEKITLALAFWSRETSLLSLLMHIL